MNSRATVERVEPDTKARGGARLGGPVERHALGHVAEAPHFRQIVRCVLDPDRERLIDIQDRGECFRIARLDKRPTECGTRGRVGRRIETGKAKGQTQALGPGLGKVSGALDQPLLVHADRDEALNRRGGAWHRCRGRGHDGLGSVDAAEHAHDAGQGGVSPFVHVRHFIEATGRGRHPHHGRLQTGLKVGVEALRGGAGAHDLVVSTA